MGKIKFGTSGWRAIISDEFTFDNLKLVVQAIADHLVAKGLKEREVIVGYDTRFLSEKFAEETCCVLAANGFHTILSMRDVPSPVISFSILKRKAAGGINITASHNPPDYSGIKFSPSWAGPALPEETDDIEKRINGLKGSYKEINPLEAFERGMIEKVDLSTPYIEDLLRKVNLSAISKAGLKIVIDPLYGTVRDYLDKILREAGCDISVLHSYRDPYFGGLTPEPSEKNLEELIRYIRKGEYDIGLATDGDADRFGIVDSDGSFIEPNYILALLFDYLVETRNWKGGVARSVATTHLIDAIAKTHSIEVYETPVGFKYIGELIAKDMIIIGGEESAGLSIKGHVPDKDGILACLLVTEMVAVKGRTIKELLEDLYERVGRFYSKRMDLRVSEDFIDKLKTQNSRLKIEEISGLMVKDTITKDGTKYIFDGGSWLLMRPSGTEPLLRLYVEAGSKADVEKLIGAGKGFVRAGER
ncbi:MAG: phosphoglucomutase/phosphomannomutase family protein [Nitrospirae bacterium]|nr:phosphoglucomutase/phosphomannomutase family protein [Nitrospirota bacterium]